MEHKSKVDGKTYEVGRVVSQDGKKTYDINLIMDWDENGQVKIVNFYFGDYDYEVTEEYIQNV